MGQVVREGTGVYDIDASRVPLTTVSGGNLADNPHLRGTKLRSASVVTGFGRAGDVTNLTESEGRFPANLILTKAIATLMDEQSGELHSQDPSTRAHPGAAKFENQGASGSWRTQKGSEGWYSDTGGASRFYNHLETV